jgi:hypothetical protein
MMALTMLAGVVTFGAAGVGAQRGQRYNPAPYDPPLADAKYDGRFTFVRLQFTTGPGGYYYRSLPAWAHGYAHAEANLLQILQAVSNIDAHVNESKVIAVGDPELCRYPVVYMTEAGYLVMNNDEAAALRAYLQKGGFVIVDDFREDGRYTSGWSNFAGVMDRVMPGGKFIPLDGKNAIFHSFYDIDAPDRFVTAYDGVTPQYYGLFENNDPTKRMLMMVNFMNDVSQYWEFSQTGMFAMDNANEAYKLGVNYIIYGITH